MHDAMAAANAALAKATARRGGRACERRTQNAPIHASDAPCDEGTIAALAARGDPVPCAERDEGDRKSHVAAPAARTATPRETSATTSFVHA